MRFYREKSWLLGLLALIAPLPLPFNEVVGWPAVIVFCGAAALFLVRTNRGENWVLPYWVMNLLGLLYIPFLIGDLSMLRTGRVLPPLVHLALFAMAVKLFALRREQDKWHLFLGLFFLFIASMATSVHPAAILYLIGFGSLASLILIRFAGLHTVSTISTSGAEPRVPVRRFLTGTILLSMVVAVPLFFFMPRLRQPYVYLPAGGSGGVVQVSGFSDRLELGMIDRVRSARTVVFRFAYETPPPPATEMRFKATTYDSYGDGGWRREPNRPASVPRDRDGFFHLADEFPVSWMKIWLRHGSNRVILPVETSVVDLTQNGVVLDGAGEARFLLPKGGTIEYRAGMTAAPVVAGWRRDRSRPAELDASSVSPRMAELAARVMGSGDPERRIGRLERHLRSEYRYSLDPVNNGRRPIERFLFDTQKGHCEYFASAMVLLLRSQGVAARMVTGYLGSDYNPFEEYFIVRQSNAHAWVEALVPGDVAEETEAGESASGRWVAFDPTPADARPQSGREGIVTLMAQVYDYLLFRWDRYVLTYGFGDQVDILIGLRNAWLSFWQAVGAPRHGENQPEQVALENSQTEDGEAPTKGSEEPVFSGWRLASMITLLVAAAIWFVVRRERFSATKAYRSLRAKVASSQPDGVPAWVGPLRLEERLNQQYPEAADETRCIVSHYLRESFAGDELSAGDLEAVKAALAGAKKKIRKSA
ncbi:MAG: DUF3488 domain-containing protein [Acidobacteria bacterium]|nr:DUF3488 domain-containing protein [Acidobacteriota bacterium]